MCADCLEAGTARRFKSRRNVRLLKGGNGGRCPPLNDPVSDLIRVHPRKSAANVIQKKKAEGSEPFALISFAGC